MYSHKPRHSILLLSAALTALLIFGTQSASAQPQAPAPFSPAEGATVTTPSFSWQAASGAAKYEVEVGPQGDPNAVSWSAQTVNRTLTPTDAAQFANGPFYWRVRAVDAGGVAGPWSKRVRFSLSIPAPSVNMPFVAEGDFSSLAPTLKWLPGEVRPTYYKVEVSALSNFMPVEATYITYNERVTPVTTLAHGKHYWRVSGVDADGHAGAPSASGQFATGSAGPALVKPAADATVTAPEMEWKAVTGAAYYKIELSTSPTFVPVLATFTTYNLAITPLWYPVPPPPPAVGVYHWRVSGVDAGGHVGASSASRFTLTGYPAADGTQVPQLSAPADGATVATSPTFRWTRVPYTNLYRLTVSKYADFRATYDRVETQYNSYTPYTAGSQDTYADGVYYWKVEARNASNAVIAISAVHSFTKAQPLLLSDPADGAKGATDPTFVWEQVVGAKRYRLVVSKFADFHVIFDSVNCDYNRYTPYTAGSVDTYPKGVYYWKVEARSSSDAVITTSKVRRFTIG